MRDKLSGFKLSETLILFTFFSSVQSFGVIGGGAALAFLGGTAATSVLAGPALGTAGLLGLGLVASAGMAGLMSLAECGGPTRCRTITFQCCPVLIDADRGRIVCPTSC